MAHRILLLGIGGDPAAHHAPAEGDFSFTSVENAAFVYDARNLSGANGSAVSAFPDEVSPTGLLVSQADALKQPVLRTGANGLNGHNVVHLDGGQYLSRPNVPSSALSLADQMTFYALVRFTSYEFFLLGWEQYPNEDGSAYARLRPIGTGGTAYLQHGGDSALYVGPSSIGGNLPEGFLNSWRWVEYWRNGSVGEVRVDGALVASGAMPNPLSQSASGIFHLFAGPNAQIPMSGQVAAVVGYNRALNPVERDYLAVGASETWGL